MGIGIFVILITIVIVGIFYCYCTKLSMLRKKSRRSSETVVTLSCLWTTVGEISAVATNMELARVNVGVSTKENSSSNGAGCLYQRKFARELILIRVYNVIKKCTNFSVA